MSKIKGLTKRREADGVVDKCILRVKEFGVRYSSDGSKYIVIENLITLDQLRTRSDLQLKSIEVESAQLS